VGKRGFIVGVVAVLAAAVPLAGSAQAKTYPVSAGPPSRVTVAHLDFDHFFNPVTTVHVGDTVRFAINGFHTVTFPARGQKPPAFILPGPTVTGVNDAAGNPLWFDGKLPRLQINPLAAFPAGGHVVNGSALVSSGVPAGNAAPPPFSVKFTRKGTFKFFCVVHPGMQGSIKVVAKGKRIPTARQDARSAKRGLAALIASGRKLGKVKPPAGTVFAGNDRGGVAWLRFFPSTITVKVGQSVQFLMKAPNEDHTITFGPAAYTTGLENSFNQVQPNPGGPPTIFFDPLGSLPSDPFPLPPYTGANHGNGFENAGVLAGQSGTPLPTKATFTFTKAGTYHYECVIHQSMDGTVVVTP
jgi:plastocyanin